MREDIHKLYLEGLSYSKIGEKLNCSKSTVAYHCNRIKKGILYKEDFKYSEKSLLKLSILKLRNEGKSYKDISLILKCSISTISYHCVNNNLSNIGLNEQRKIERGTKICNGCGIEFILNGSKREKRFCNRECYDKSEEKKDLGRRFGLYSSQLQKDIRRSKNEIYFFDLCNKKYNEVLNNEAIFNGWDADIIITDCKIAILWNGVWHYKKITKKHSVEQVQNRDRIKIKEIKSCGYIPYVIKDMGAVNKKFVEQEFEKLTGYISSLS